MLFGMGRQYLEIKKWVIERKQQRRPWTGMIDIYDQQCRGTNLERDLNTHAQLANLTEQ